MHISDGLLPLSACLAGYGGAAVMVGASLRRLPDEEIPKVAILSSAFFVASLIHLKVGPSSVHLTLNGLVGLLLAGRASVPIFVGLLFQALLFGHGGITTLGVNTINMALPAVIFGSLARRLVDPQRFLRSVSAAAVCGAAAPLAALGFVFAWSLVADPAYRSGLGLLATAHVPVVILEGVICGATIAYLLRVRPSLVADRAG